MHVVHTTHTAKSRYAYLTFSFGIPIITTIFYYFIIMIIISACVSERKKRKREGGRLRRRKVKCLFHFPIVRPLYYY